MLNKQLKTFYQFLTKSNIENHSTGDRIMPSGYVYNPEKQGF